MKVAAAKSVIMVVQIHADQSGKRYGFSQCLHTVLNYLLLHDVLLQYKQETFTCMIQITHNTVHSDLKLLISHHLRMEYQHKYP
jgi:hypothetical protein